MDPSRIMTMRILLLCACVAVSLAAEAEAKPQAKPVWLSAAKAGDAWTCLQLEAWARMQKPAVRLGGILGESTLIGEPLFTFPVRIDHLADLGDRIIVIAGARIHVLGIDGRPLQMAQAVPPWGELSLGYGGRMAAAWTVDGKGFHLTAVQIGDGQRPIVATSPRGAGLSQGDAVTVADDGSAAAAQIEVQDPTSGHVTYSTLVATAEGQTLRPGLPAGLLGIGRSGAWLLAGEAPRVQVQVGETRRDALAAAAGPGMAACIAGGAAHLILADGKQVALGGVPAIGTDPGMATVGTWLVMFSGYEAKSVSQGDLLGEGGGVEAIQPPTLVLWRWADLAADPASKPAASLRGEFSISMQHPAALWIWEGPKLDLVDLSGNEPRREERLVASAPIRWASSELHCVRLNHEKGVKALHGPDNSLLWIGPCDSITVKRRDLALIQRLHEGRYSWSLVRLSADPQQRTEARLDLPEEEQSLRVSHAAPDIVLARGERGTWRTTSFAGALIETGIDAGLKPTPPPPCPEWQWYTPVGRFMRDGARVRGKNDPPGDDPLSGVSLVDAWRVGTTTVLLDRSGRVLLSGRKRGEWLDLPAVAPADRLALSGTGPVLVSGDGLHPVAALVPGPKLEARQEPGGVQELPSGSWRLERRWRFTPPRGRQMEWDTERVGWRPVRLRSPEAGGLLIVTPAVVIELDPVAAKLFGE